MAHKNEAPEAAAPKKNNIKKLVVPVAVVLIVAIVLGIAASAKSKPMAAFDALKKTVFETGAVDAKLTQEEQLIYSADVRFGEGVADSQFEIKMGERIFSLSKGMIKIDGLNYGKVDDVLYQSEARAELEAYGINLDFLEVLDAVINEKIDEDEVEKLYDSQIVPNTEKEFKAYYEMDIELPDYEDTMKIVERFIKKGITDEALTAKKADSKEDGKTYSFAINVEQMAVCIGEFLKSDKQTRKILEKAVATSVDKELTVESFVDSLVKEYEGYDEPITGQITIASGRITRVYLDRDKIEVRIISIK